MNSEGTEVGLLDTLAAGYAEIGIFDKAIKYQLQAIQQLQSTKQLDRLKLFEQRLKVYQQGKPWRMPVN